MNRPTDAKPGCLGFAAIGSIVLVPERAPTTTLGTKGPVKPENPRGESPVNLKNLSLPYETARPVGRTGTPRG